MGKGDRRTTKGKRILGTYGNTRKRKKSTPTATLKEAAPKKKAAAKKTTAKKETAKKTTAKKATAKKTVEKKED